MNIRAENRAHLKSANPWPQLYQTYLNEADVNGVIRTIHLKSAKSNSRNIR
jgi:hypothetical protein